MNKKINETEVFIDIIPRLGFFLLATRLHTSLVEV